MYKVNKEVEFEVAFIRIIYLLFLQNIVYN
jgi:hypothetical protein